MEDDFSILFVDDDRQILDVVSAYLKRAGYQVDTVNNGFVALENLRQKEYSVVFTDLIMPEISGESAYGQINRVR